MTMDKTSALKGLLVKAWRERWSDVQWSIHLKEILPRGCCGDVYDLSGLILRQALMSPIPNRLLIGYLRHSLATHTVSHAALLEAIATGFQATNPTTPMPQRGPTGGPPHGTAALLDLVALSLDNVTARGKPEECLMLATSLLKIASWLLKIIQTTLMAMGAGQDTPIGEVMMEG